jgi:hypothetical protein
MMFTAALSVFRTFRFLSDSQFSSQAFSIASLLLLIFPVVDFITPNYTAIARWQTPLAIKSNTSFYLFSGQLI